MRGSAANDPAICACCAVRVTEGRIGSGRTAESEELKAERGFIFRLACFSFLSSSSNGARMDQSLPIRKQSNNANKHTERGLDLLETSITRDGWIGAITVAADGEAFDGSARIAVSENLDDAIVIRSDGR